MESRTRGQRRWRRCSVGPVSSGTPTLCQRTQPRLPALHHHVPSADRMTENGRKRDGAMGCNGGHRFCVLNQIDHDVKPCNIKTGLAA